jgi:hypothetical protein
MLPFVTPALTRRPGRVRSGVKNGVCCVKL